MDRNIIVLGVGNVLEKDDGVGIYAATYLNANYAFGGHLRIINGGVEGINLLNLFLENDHVIILDTILLEDEPGSIYNIPSHELRGFGLNSGGAHEVGVMQCLDMIELMGHPLPESNVMGIVPAEISFEMGLSEELTDQFEAYISAIIGYLQQCDVDVSRKDTMVSLPEIIETFRYPEHRYGSVRK